MSADLFEAFGYVPPSTNSNAPKTSNAPDKPLISDSLLIQPACRFVDIAPPGQSLWHKDDEGADVLFDASDDAPHADDDDFGDFEDAPVENVQPSTTEATEQRGDLLGLDDLVIQPVAARAPPKTATHVSTGDVYFDTVSEGIHGAKTSQYEKQSATRPTQQEPQFHCESETTGEDDWGDFEAIGAGVSSQPDHYPNQDKMSRTQSTNPQSASEFDDGDWDVFDDDSLPTPQPTQPPSRSTMMPSVPKPITQSPSSVTTKPQTQAEHRERPTNIPPPLSLLTLLPKVYSLLASNCKLVTRSTPSSTLQSLVKDIIVAHRTTARIIAGRTHRWKRDPHLSQSMRIAPASAQKGMKLTSLDKSESIKENQLVLDVIVSYTSRAHVFNSTLARAGLKKAQKTLAAQIPIRVASGPGVLTANVVCAICGLKRNERVVGVDEDIDDVLGEFWTEFWGHAECEDFWYRYRELLDQR